MRSFFFAFCEHSGNIRRTFFRSEGRSVGRRLTWGKSLPTGPGPMWWRALLPIAPFSSITRLLAATGSRHTTRPAHAVVGGHHTTFSPHVLYCVPTNPGPRSFHAWALRRCHWPDPQPIVQLLKPYSNLGPPIFRPPKVHEPVPNISRSRISRPQRVHL